MIRSRSMRASAKKNDVCLAQQHLLKSMDAATLEWAERGTARLVGAALALQLCMALPLRFVVARGIVFGAREAALAAGCVTASSVSC